MTAPQLLSIAIIGVMMTVVIHPDGVALLPRDLRERRHRHAKHTATASVTPAHEDLTVAHPSGPVPVTPRATVSQP